MPKFYGPIGYGKTIEKSAGVYDYEVTERNYYGDVTRVSKRNETSSYISDDIQLNNQISILADAYAYNHFSEIIYIKWMNVYWKISSVEVQRPRLIFSLGGVYNGPTVESSKRA